MVSDTKIFKGLFRKYISSLCDLHTQRTTHDRNPATTIAHHEPMAHVS